MFIFKQLIFFIMLLSVVHPAQALETQSDAANAYSEIYETLYSMIQGLGPVLIGERSPATIKPEREKKIREQQSPRKFAKITRESQLAPEEILSHKDYLFKGTEEWSGVKVIVVETKTFFEINIQAERDITDWVLYDKEGVVIEIGKAPELESFYFIVYEKFDPPYVLTATLNDRNQAYHIELYME